MELFLPHGPLGGRVASIASKSQLQRLLLCAALADRETVVHGASDAADVQAMVATLTGYYVAASTDPREVYRVGLQSVPFLLAVGDLLIGWLLLWHAEVAMTALDGQPSDRDQAFYRGKITAATFFATNVLPRLSADRRAVENTELAAMELAEDAF